MNYLESSTKRTTSAELNNRRAAAPVLSSPSAHSGSCAPPPISEVSLPDSAEKKTNAEYCREYKVKLKKLVMGWYGGKCRCCSTAELPFLTLDHIDDSGRVNRVVCEPTPGTAYTRIIKIHNGISLEAGGYKMYLAIKRLGKENRPKDLQILCFNCQWGKRIERGFCPHNPSIDLRVAGAQLLTTPDAVRFRSYHRKAALTCG